MKEIKAIIQTFQLDSVIEGLRGIPKLPGCIVSHVKTFGRNPDKHTRVESLEPTDRTKLEIVVNDEMVESVLLTIQKHARTGNVGDGKIFVIECVDIMRIRTGERGKNAL